ncbi:MAG: hypothetical protein ACODAE_11615, partial [Gemmatimonadota bacterium]
MSPGSARVPDGVGALLLLARIEGVGPATIRGLVDGCGDPLEALLVAARGTGRPGDGRREAVETRLRGRSRETLLRMAAKAATAAERELGPSDRVLGYGLPGYPARLGRLHCPPPVL